VLGRPPISLAAIGLRTAARLPERQPAHFPGKKKKSKFPPRERNTLKSTMDDPTAHARFTRLLFHHQPEILRAVRMRVPHAADAQEIVQETSLALWKKFASYDPTRRSFGQWAQGFVRIELLRFRRKRGRRPALSEQALELLATTEEEMAAELDDRTEHLRECLAHLPSRQRSMIHAYYSDEMDVAAIAAAQARSVDAIYKALQRVRAALLDCIARKLARTDRGGIES